MGLYNGITGSGNQAQRSTEPEPFNPIEREFGGSYRSYRINGRPRMDAETFFRRIRKGLIDLIKRELNDLNSARIQTTTWIRFVKAPSAPQAGDYDRVELAFNSKVTNVYQGSDLEQILDGMIAHMKTQVENPALLNSKFIFDEVLYLDTNFHRLNLIRGNSYLPLPDWIEKRKAIINPQKNDEECFKWAVIAALDWSEIKSHPERVSNLRKFVDNYDWFGLKFPVAIKDIKVFEMNNDITINILLVENRDIYICRKGN